MTSTSPVGALRRRRRPASAPQPHSDSSPVPRPAMPAEPFPGLLDDDLLPPVAPRARDTPPGTRSPVAIPLLPFSACWDQAGLGPRGTFAGIFWFACRFYRAPGIFEK